MEQQPINYGQVIKREHVSYMKHAASLYNGEMILTDLRIMLRAQKSVYGIFGALMSAMKTAAYTPHMIFDLPLTEIREFEKGKWGLQKNLLDLMTRDGRTFRIMVKSYPEWEELLGRHLGGSPPAPGPWDGGVTS
jgi:hypothetical protein